MTELKMPPLDRSPGLSPSPRTEEPGYPSVLTALIVQVAALRGRAEELETERDAATARAEKAEALLAEATAFSLEPSENSDVWWAFECFHCFHEFGSSGLVFDVRLPVSVELPIAKCPHCGTECEFKQSWGATQRGYGARGDGGLVTRVQELEAQVKQQDAALDRRTKALKTLNALPAFQESLLMTSVAPTVDHGAALLNTIAAANDCMFQLEMERHAEALIAERDDAIASAEKVEERAEKAEAELAQVKTLVRRVFDSGDTQDLLSRAVLTDEPEQP
jgi:hypothetical protein